MKKMLQGKCPRCHSGAIFSSHGNVFTMRFPKMNPECPHCQHKFEKEPGYFIGAMYVSYALAVLEMGLIFLSTFAFFSYPMILGSMIVGVSLLSFFNFRFARIIWIWIFQQ